MRFPAKLVSRSLLFLIALAAISSSALAQAGASDERRKAMPGSQENDSLRGWTTSDSVAMTYYGQSSADWIGNAERSSFELSPDGRYAFVVTTRGDLHDRCTIQTLEVWDTQEIRRGLEARQRGAVVGPMRSIEMRTRIAGGQAISSLQWEDDTSIAFLGTDSGDEQQVFRLNVPSGKLQAVTAESSVYKSMLSASKGAMIYRRTLPLDPMPDVTTRVLNSLAAAVRQSPADGLNTLGVPRDTEGNVDVLQVPDSVRFEWRASLGNGEVWTLPVGNPIFTRTWYSPSGDRAVMALFGETPRLSGKIIRFVIVDFQHCTVAPLCDAADVDSRNRSAMLRSFWSPDGDRVILQGVKVPDVQAVRPNPAPSGYVAEYEFFSKTWKILEPYNSSTATIRTIGWLKPGEELLVGRQQDDRAIDGTIYTRLRDGWVGRPAPPSAHLDAVESLPGLRLEVRQGANKPPELVASDGVHDLNLSQPDPALHGIWIAPTRPITFQTPNGTNVTGGLSMPRDASQAHPVPLVVFLGEYRPDVFLPDGTVPSGYARQALVAQGIAVFEMSSDRKIEMTLEEGPGIVARFEAAVRAAAGNGFIDLTRIGIMGHSRMGYLALYNVTHPSAFPVAAAVAYDSTTLSFPEYLYRKAADVGGSYDPERSHGGPFWRNKEKWLEQDILFNVDRAQTPTLFVENQNSGETTRDTQPYTLESMGAFELNHRPADWMFVPKSNHVSPNPVLHKEAMDLTVDWMCFWLLGRENPDPHAAWLFQRWRTIREKWLRQQAWEAAGNPVGSPPDKNFRTEAGLQPIRSPLPNIQPVKPILPPPVVSAENSESNMQRSQILAEMHVAGVADPKNNPQLLNSLGYQFLYSSNDPKRALQYFRWNLALFADRAPRIVSQLEDSLAEGYLQAGEVAEAIAHYSRSAELDPKNESASQIAAKLKVDPKTLPALQKQLLEASGERRAE